MALVNGGLLSFRARGQIGKAVVYSDWKGQNYARVYTIPANPRTTAQEAVRSCFGWCHDTEKLAAGLVQDTWAAYAKGKPLTPNNVFLKYNLSNLIGQENLSEMVMTAASNGGVPLAAMTLEAAAGGIDVTMTLPPIPTGWTLTGVSVGWVVDQVPAGEHESSGNIQAAASTSPYTSYDITELTTGQLYWVAAWPIWAKSDGSTAYGGPIMSSATPT